MDDGYHMLDFPWDCPVDAKFRVTSSGRLYCLQNKLVGRLSVSLYSLDDDGLDATIKLIENRIVQFPLAILREIDLIIDHVLDANGYAWMIGRKLTNEYELSCKIIQTYRRFQFHWITPLQKHTLEM